MDDTIFALSSGLPPAGIAIIRVSGPNAGAAVCALAGGLPPPRHARHARFHHPDGGGLIDDGLLLWFPGPKTATGEDLAEFHVHGGRAIVAAMLDALGKVPGCRAANAGEFTRRSFENGRIDLTQAEGLADLLAAETETQRKGALALAEGGMARLVEQWQAALLTSSALVEADLDFSDEDDVASDRSDHGLSVLVADIHAMLENPPAERLRDGVRVVIAGPPNAGKSSLFNVLVGRDAAIVTEIAGTTRDRIDVPVVLGGVPMLFVDTAGLRDDGADVVEIMGIARSVSAMAEADILIWMGGAEELPPGALLVAGKSDLRQSDRGLAVSVVTGAGLLALRSALVERAKALLPAPDMLALNARHRAILSEVAAALVEGHGADDLLIKAEYLRIARNRLDGLTGRSGVEDMLDALFGRFCVGK
jgi:tRNA modification GTPase